MTEPTETLEERVAARIARPFQKGEAENLYAVAREIIAMCREVKPPIWDQHGEITTNGDYMITKIRKGGFEVVGPLRMCETHPTYEAAKAAAEAHHVERVRGMLR